MNTPAMLGLAAGPLFAVILFGVIALGVKLAIAMYMPDCWLKRQILKERFKSKYSASNRKVLEHAAKHPDGWHGSD